MSKEELELKIEQLEKEKSEAIQNYHYEYAASIRDKVRKLKEEIEKLEKNED